MWVSLDVPLLELTPALTLHCRVHLGGLLGVVEKILVELFALLALVAYHLHFNHAPTV